jgi:hypothetical protein
VHGQAGRLAEDQEVRVLVDDLERDVLGEGPGGNGLGHVDQDALARAEASGGARGVTLEEHVPLTDQGLDAGAAQAGKRARQPGVEP